MRLSCLDGLVVSQRASTPLAAKAMITRAPRSGNDRLQQAGDYRQNEWAGACYSPDGNWLFVNIQTPGVTFAITGPWGHGPL